VISSAKLGISELSALLNRDRALSVDPAIDLGPALCTCVESLHGIILVAGNGSPIYVFSSNETLIANTVQVQVTFVIYI